MKDVIDNRVKDVIDNQKQKWSSLTDIEFFFENDGDRVGASSHSVSYVMCVTTKTSSVLVTTCNGCYTCSTSFGSKGGSQHGTSEFRDASGKYVFFKILVQARIMFR